LQPGPGIKPKGAQQSNRLEFPKGLAAALVLIRSSFLSIRSVGSHRSLAVNGSEARCDRSIATTDDQMQNLGRIRGAATQRRDRRGRARGRPIPACSSTHRNRIKHRRSCGDQSTARPGFARSTGHACQKLTPASRPAMSIWASWRRARSPPPRACNDGGDRD
jgi:hypothetical protein